MAVRRPKRELMVEQDFPVATGRQLTPNVSAGLVGFARIIIVSPGSMTVAEARAVRALALDCKGNVYTGEVDAGMRCRNLVTSVSARSDLIASTMMMTEKTGKISGTLSPSSILGGRTTP